MAMQYSIVPIGGVTGARDLLAGIGGALCHLRKAYYIGPDQCHSEKGHGDAVRISGLHHAVCPALCILLGGDDIYITSSAKTA